MSRILSCPACRTPLSLPPNSRPRRVQCPACGCQFPAEPEAPEILDVIPVEDDPAPVETRVRPAPRPAPVRTQRPQQPVPAGCLLYGLALTPLGVAALGIPFCRFDTGWAGAAGWAALGALLTLTCLGLVRRVRWSWGARMGGTLGLAGAGYLLLLAALGVSLWQWMLAIPPTAWRDFSPPGGRCHVSMPGTPVARPAPGPGLPRGLQVYEVELRRQDYNFAVSYMDVPLQEWNTLPLQARFDGSRDGMVANMPGSRVAGEKRVAVDNNPGREYHLLLPRKGMMVARVYFVRNRLFVLGVAGSRVKPDSPDVVKFLDSFRPDPLDPKEFPPLRPDQQPPDIEDEDIYPGRKVLGREEHPMTRVVISRDGGTVAVGCEEGTIDLWDLGRGDRLGRLRLPVQFHQPFYRPHFALSPDGKTLAADALGDGLKLFDARTQAETARLAAAGPGDFGTGLAFSPGGRYLASGHYRRAGDRIEVLLWDVAARKTVRSFSGKELGSAMVFTPDGQYLVNGGKDGTIRWLDPLTGGEVKQLAVRPNKGAQTLPVTALAFTADGTTLAASYQFTLRLWNVDTGESRELFGLPGGIAEMDLSANGRFVATGSGNGELRVAEAAAGKVRWSQPGFDLGRVEPAAALAFTPDGKRLVLGRQKRVELWDLEKLIRATPEELSVPKKRPAVVEPQPSPGGLPPRIDAHVTKDAQGTCGVREMALSADGKTLITTGWERRLCFWDLAGGKKRAERPPGEEPVALAAAPAGKTVAVATPSAVSLYDAEKGELLTNLTPDATEIVTCMMPPDILEVTKRLNKGKLPAPPPGTVRVSGLAFTPDGETLAVAYPTDRSGVIELWDVAARKVRRRLVAASGGLGRLLFSPDGQTLVTWRDNDPEVRLYDVPTGKEMARLRGIGWGVTALACSGDGKYLAAAGGAAGGVGSMVLLWDAHTGRELKRFTDHTQTVWGLAFSPDGKTLASGGQDGKVHVYDTASGQRIGRFSAYATSLLFDRKGRTLLVGTGNGEGWVDLWDVTRLPRPKSAPEAARPPARPTAFGKDLQRVGRIEPYLAGVVDPQSGRALFLGRDRFLRVYSYPDFKPERAYWLGAIAYRAALDRERGMLYAAACDVQALDYLRAIPAGGPGDLHVYDVKKILAGEDPGGHVLRPATVIRLKAKIARLETAPDNRWVYYLDVAGVNRQVLGRIDAATRARDGEANLDGVTGGMCLGRDGKALYVGRGGRTPTIEVFDAVTMKWRESIQVPLTPVDIVAGEDGRIYFGPLGILDTKPARPAVAAHWALPAPGGMSMHLAVPTGRVYVAHQTSPSTIEAYEVPDKQSKDRPAPVDTLSDAQGGSLLGELMVTPDGKYLLCQTGAVVRLARPGINRPLPDPAEGARAPADSKGSPWRERAPLSAPKETVFHALAVSPDGRKLAAGGGDGTVNLYDRETGRLLAQQINNPVGVGYLTFSPDGKSLACTFLNRKAQVNAVSHGGPISYLWYLSGQGRDAVAFTPDGRELAIAGEEPRRGNFREPEGKEIVFWRANKTNVARSIAGFPDPLTAVALSPDGKQAAAGSTSGPVYVVDVGKPTERRSLTGHGGEVRCVAYAPDGKALASGGVDGTVRLWDPATGKQLRVLGGHRHVALCLAFSPDGKTLATGGADGVLRLWDPETGKERGVIRPRRPGSMVYAVAFGPDGKALAAACGEEVRQWDLVK